MQKKTHRESWLGTKCIGILQISTGKNFIDLEVNTLLDKKIEAFNRGQKIEANLAQLFYVKVGPFTKKTFMQVSSGTKAPQVLTKGFLV